MSILRNLSILGIIAFLFGCRTSNPYQKKNGEWEYDGQPIRTADNKSFEPLNKRFARDKDRGYYRGSAVENSDGNSFTAITDHYAKDKRAVFFCDTYRKGQEYYLYKYNTTIEVAGADPTSFRFFKDEYGYMRDDHNLFHDGKLFAVKDISSFQSLGSSFDRDDVSAYYHQKEIKGSDGKSFTVLDTHYSKDTGKVYFSDIGSNEFVTSVVEGASPSTFELLKEGYAKSGQRIYFYGKLVTANGKDFEVLGAGYSKNTTQVFHYGKALQGADAASFNTNITAEDSSDSYDKKGKFLDGKRLK